MKKISARESIKAGWRKFKERPWYFSGILAAVIGIVMATAGNAMYTALSMIAYAGYLVLFLRHYDGTPVVFDDMFSIDSRWISFAFLMIIKGFFIFLGILLLIVPGVYLALRWMYAELLVIDKGLRPMEALRESARLTKGNMWGLFRFSLLGSLVLILGLLLLIVGVIPASIILSFAVISMYRDAVAVDQS